MPSHISTATTDTFQSEVMEASLTCPIVADFWADWCQPCKQLMPILEKLADDYAGRFRLVKINVDESPEIAGALGIQSIPFVVAFLDGQPVSQLPGVADEAGVRQWLDSFLPSPAIDAFNAGLEAEAAGKTDEAEVAFRRAVELDDDAAFRIALARVLIALNRDQEAAEIIAALESRGFLEPDAEILKDQLAMRTHVEESGGTKQARDELAADPGNRNLQARLAEALAVDKQYEEACDLLLDIISNESGPAQLAAKEAMVTILSAMGPKSKLASDYRRKLATAFY